MSNSEKFEELVPDDPEAPEVQLAFVAGCSGIHRAYTRSASMEPHCWDGSLHEEAWWSSDEEGEDWKGKT